MRKFGYSEHCVDTGAMLKLRKADSQDSDRTASLFSFLLLVVSLACFLLQCICTCAEFSFVEAIKANNKERKLAKKRKVRLVKVSAFSFQLGEMWPLLLSS